MQNLIDFLFTIESDPRILSVYVFWLVLFVLCAPPAIKEYREWSKLQDEADRLMGKRK